MRNHKMLLHSVLQHSSLQQTQICMLVITTTNLTACSLIQVCPIEAPRHAVIIRMYQFVSHGAGYFFR